ncbi:hypothetical protein Hokovirus_3_77 [Hokovirus HKV1]|uniref:Uncharacterized protein n=1 Tax=Hokovirus HKV1 TaxID=1977638 RepID=A0A1V0SGN3_9VIRU|nr:hypothetical protein Hokovirus_3_77 [Hokovirus HKV1]
MIFFYLLLFVFGLLFGYFISNYMNPIKGPNSNIIRNKIFNVNGKCYKMIPQVNICS